MTIENAKAALEAQEIIIKEIQKRLAIVRDAYECVRNEFENALAEKGRRQQNLIDAYKAKQ